MKIKCGRKEYEVDASDRILDNGKSYILITRKNNSGVSPVVSKTQFKSLAKSGIIVLANEKYRSMFGEDYDLYRFAEVGHE